MPRVLLMNAVIALCLNSAGCLSKNETATKKSSPASSSNSTAGSIFGAGGLGVILTGGRTAITLTQAMPSNLDPASALDLIGRDNEINLHCPTLSACRCRLNWTQDGSARQIDEAPLYLENNLMRCDYSSLRTIPTFSIQIVIMSGGILSSAGSNSLNFRNNYLDASLDRSVANNYSRVVRYQCRDLPRINTTLYQGIQDPQLWNLSYVFNLYTTSLGKDYGYTAAYFDCPTSPTTFLGREEGSPTHDGLYDMRIESVLAHSGDSTIYPVNDSPGESTRNNRHDFYLANFRDGVFREPVCVPHTLTTAQNSLSGRSIDCTYDNSVSPARVGADVIGFAAVPDGSEACPVGSVTLPPEKKWAKLWQFRASLPIRTAISITNSAEIGSLYCTSTALEWTAPEKRSDTREFAATPNGGIRYNLLGNANGVFGGFENRSISSSLNFGNCLTQNSSDNSCALTDGAARYSSFGGYGYQLGRCAGTPRDTFCSISAGEFLSIYPSALTSGAPRLRHGGTQNAGSGVAFNPLSARTEGFVSPPTSAPRGKGGTHCNLTLPGDYWAYGDGLGSFDTWIVSSGSITGCIESDTDAAGNLFNDRSQNFLGNEAGIGAFQHPIKNWFDFIGVTCPETGDCSVPPVLPLTHAASSPSTSWGGYGIFQFGDVSLESSSSSDFLYVVTDPSVTRTAMANPADPIFLKHQPRRKIASRAGLGGVNIDYGLESGGLNSADPRGRAPIYPLCVIQDAD